jgi:hypothetical protein
MQLFIDGGAKALAERQMGTAQLAIA